MNKPCLHVACPLQSIITSTCQAPDDVYSKCRAREVPDIFETVPFLHFGPSAAEVEEQNMKSIRIPAPKMILYKYAIQFHQNWIAIYKGPEKTHTHSDGRETTYRDLEIARCVSHCVIHPMDTAKWYSGIAVLNPKDKNNVLAGYKQAFGKALDDHWNNLDTDLDLISFKKYFWEAFLKKNFTDDALPSDLMLRVKLPEGTIK